MYGRFDVFLAIVLALLALINGDPLVDIPRTSLDLIIGRTSHNSQQIVIAINRVDDLFGDNGELVAAKFNHVVLNFKITKNQIMLNDVPIEYGTSNLKIEAALAITPEALTMSPAQVLGAFDQGIIGLQVIAIRDKVYNSTLGRVVDRVILQEIITEVNGLEVIQTGISQQIIDLDDNGSITGYLPYLQGEFVTPDVPLTPEEMNSGYPYGLSSLRDRLHSWIHENPQVSTTSVLATLIISGFLACFVLLPLFIYRRLRERKYLDCTHDEIYSRIAQYESEMGDEKFDSLEKTNEEQILIE